MLSEFKKMKIENMVREIEKVRNEDMGNMCSFHQSGTLRLAFDYDKLNDYAKAIVDNVQMVIDNDENRLGKLVKLEKKHEDAAERRELVKDFVFACRKNPDCYCRGSMRNAYYFIFWSLMILTVDENDKEDRVSVICDFAKMFIIPDEEVKDIVELIKIIYDRSEYKELSANFVSKNSFWGLRDNEKAITLRKVIKTERILHEFSELINLYMGFKGEDVVWLEK